MGSASTVALILMRTFHRYMNEITCNLPSITCVLCVAVKYFAEPLVTLTHYFLNQLQRKCCTSYLRVPSGLSAIVMRRYVRDRAMQCRDRLHEFGGTFLLCMCI